MTRLAQLRVASWPRIPRTAWVLAVFCSVVLVWGWWVSPDARTREHLGAEYFNIGRALWDGRGFSDPFAEATGPTAWMPPAYPALIATLLALLGSRGGVAIAVQLLAAASYVVVGTRLYQEAKRRGSRGAARTAVGMYVAWLFLFQYWFFHLTTDIWLISGVLFAAALLWLEEGVAVRRPVAWGLLGGASTLVSPAVFSAWLALHVSSFPGRSTGRRAWAGALVLALALSAPWTLRNAIQFGKLIPTKSNLMFELHQANVLDDDGIYDLKTMNQHPYNERRARHEYARLGEIAYVREHGQQFLKQAKENPAGLLRRVGRRAWAAFMAYEPLLPDERNPLELGPKRVVYVSPLACLLLALAVRGPGRSPLLRLAALWGAYLVPYVFVAFYVRYGLPLLPLAALTLGLSVHRIAARLERRRAAPELEPHGLLG